MPSILGMSCMPQSVIIITIKLTTALWLSKLIIYNSFLVSSSNLDVSCLMYLWQRAIIAKLPLTWRDFATALKYRRENKSIENVLASVDVDEKACIKDDAPKTRETYFNAQVIQLARKIKGNLKIETSRKNAKRINMKDIICYVCMNTWNFKGKNTMVARAARKVNKDRIFFPI